MYGSYVNFPNISLCRDLDQFSDLYKYLIDNDLRYHHAKPNKVLTFIDDFAKYIETITDANTQGIRLLLKKHYEVNIKLFSDSQFPGLIISPPLTYHCGKIVFTAMFYFIAYQALCTAIEKWTRKKTFRY